MNELLLPETDAVEGGRDPLTEKVLRFKAIAGEAGYERDALFAEIWDECEGRIRAQAKRMLHNDADIAEAVQEVGLRMLRKIDQFRGDSRFQTWLHLLAFNDILRFRQKTGRRERHFEQEPEEEIDVEEKGPVVTAADLLARHEIAQAVQDGIDRINPTYRLYVVLADLEGFTNEEIRDTFGVSIAVVKNCLNRGRQQLADVLDDMGIVF